MSMAKGSHDEHRTRKASNASPQQPMKNDRLKAKQLCTMPHKSWTIGHQHSKKVPVNTQTSQDIAMSRTCCVDVIELTFSRDVSIVDEDLGA
jgi:hypothetical protein